MVLENKSRIVLVCLGLAGFGLRLALVPLPILDDNNWLRQTQTADAAQSFLDHGFWPPAPIASWRGDLDARLVLELPLYTYLAAFTGRLVGDLDLAGRLISAILWGCSYLILQRIWRRFLTEEQACYASLLFVIAPISVELGVAFMPEMLLQVCAFGFVLAVLRYLEDSGPLRLAVAGLTGGVGVCVKMPEIFHLYILFLFLLWQTEGFRAALRLRYRIFAIFTLGVLKLWGGYVDSVNSAHFSEWRASVILERLSTDFPSLWNPHNYFKVAAYLTAFLMTPVGVPLVVLGLAEEIKKRRWRELPMTWVAASAIFYLVWGPMTAMQHAYYNMLPLAPLAALFGIGMARVRAMARGKGDAVLALGRRCEIVIVGCVLVCAGGGAAYLLRQDMVVHSAAAWIRENVPAEDLVLVKSNHSDYTVSYRHVPGYSYYSGRRTWIWTQKLPEDEKARAVETSKWLLVTERPAELPWYQELRQFVKRYERPPEDMSWLTDQKGVSEAFASGDFVVYRLNPPHDISPES